MTRIFTELLYRRHLKRGLVPLLPSITYCLARVDSPLYFSYFHSAIPAANNRPSGDVRKSDVSGHKKLSLKSFYVNQENKTFFSQKMEGCRYQPPDIRGFGEIKSVFKEKVGSIIAILQKNNLANEELDQAFTLNPSVRDRLRSFHGQVNEYDVVDIFRCLEGKPALAFGFFRWARSQPAFKTDKYVMCALMKIIGRAKEFAILEYLWNEFMTMTGEPPNIIAYNETLKAYAEAHQFDKMLTTYDRMLAMNLIPNSFTISIIIRGLVKARREYDALEFFEKAKKFKCDLDHHLYGDLIDLYGKLKQSQHVDGIFQEMMSTGQVPNVLVFSRLMQTYCKANLGKKALDLFEQMKKIGVYPDCVIYLTLIDYFAKQRDKENVEYLLHEALCRDKVHLDIVFYSGCVNIFVKNNQLSDAEDLIATMKVKGVAPEHGTYLILLSSYVKKGFLNEAKSLVAKMRKELGHIDTLTYISLMNLCLECKTKEEVSSLLYCMEACGHWLHNVVLQLLSSPEVVCKGDSFWKTIGNKLKNLKVGDAREADHAIMSVVAFMVQEGEANCARRFWIEARTQGFLGGVQYRSANMWMIDLHNLHPLAVEPVLKVEFSRLGKFCEGDNCPESIHVITGWGRSSNDQTNKIDSVKTRVSTIFESLDAPFYQSHNNGGRQTARGLAGWTWLRKRRTREWLSGS